MNYQRLSNATAVAIFTCMTLFTGLEAAGTEAPVKDFAAVRGDRTAGWLPQTRSEVLARNGVVATSQPLAAQAGLPMQRRSAHALPLTGICSWKQKKLAYTDLYAFNADPGFSSVMAGVSVCCAVPERQRGWAKLRTCKRRQVRSQFS